MPRTCKKIETVPQMPQRPDVPGAGKPERPESRREKAERLLARASHDIGEEAAVRERIAQSVRVGKARKKMEIGLQEEGIEKDLDYLERGIEPAYAKQEASEKAKAIEADKAAAGRKAKEFLRLHKIDLQEMEEREKFEKQKTTRNKIAESYKTKFDEDLAAAERDQHLKLAAVDYKELSKQRNWLEKEIRRRTGHDADEINLDASLVGGVMGRARDNVRGWFSKLAGKPEATTQDLMKQWRKTSARLENLSREISPPSKGDHGIKMRARAARERTDEEMETKRALDREAARHRREEEAETPYFKKEGAPALRLAKQIGKIENLTKELKKMDDNELLGRQESLKEEAAELFKALKAEEQSGKITDEPGRSMLKDAWDALELFGSVYDKRYGELTEMARRAPKGERVRSVITRVERSSGGKTYGAGATERVGRRSELYAKPGPKTELGVTEELATEADAYRSEHAADIKRVMTELPEASKMWNEISARLSKLDAEKFAALTKIFGTRDVATAYVLNAADYQIEKRYAGKPVVGRKGEAPVLRTLGLDKKAKESQSKIIDANMALGLLPNLNLDTHLASLGAKEAIPLTRIKKSAKKEAGRKASLA